MENKIEQPINENLSAFSNTYHEQLIILGIRADLLAFEGIDYARLHRLLCITRIYSVYRCIAITEKWQIAMLHDPMEVLTNSPQTIFTKKDNLGFGIGHYAAWSGKVEALDWLLKNNPELLDVIGTGNRGIGHFAALSGFRITMEWVLINRPHLLPLDNEIIQDNIALSGSSDTLDLLIKHRPTLADDEFSSRISGYTFVFCIVLSGSIEALDWVLRHRPQFLDLRNKSKQNIADFAAQSGCIDAWDWVLKYRPKAIKEHIEDCVFYAALSGSAQLLNRVLSMTSNPKKLVIDPNNVYFDRQGKKERRKLAMIMYNTLHSFLKTNYSLTSYSIEPLYDEGQIKYINIDEMEAIIQPLLNRNRVIARVKMECISLFQGVKDKPAFYLDILECLLKVMLPDELNSEDVLRIKNEILSIVSSPTKRAVEIIGRETSRLMPYTKANKSLLFFCKKDSDGTIQALTELATLLECPFKLLDWEIKHATLLEDEQMRQCVSGVKLALGFEMNRNLTKPTV